MAEMPFPYYRLQANGSNEAGFVLLLQIDEGGGGPLPGLTTESVLNSIRDLLVNGDDTIRSSLTRYEVTTIPDL